MGINHCVNNIIVKEAGYSRVKAEKWCRFGQINEVEASCETLNEVVGGGAIDYFIELYVTK